MPAPANARSIACPMANTKPSPSARSRPAALNPPDIALFYATPGAMMYFINGLQWVGYKRFDWSVVGETACADSWGRALNTREPSLSIPCFAERRYGGVLDDEMLMALPPELIAKALDRHGRTGKSGLRYPFPQYGIQMDVRDGMSKSYPDRGRTVEPQQSWPVAARQCQRSPSAGTWCRSPPPTPLSGPLMAQLQDRAFDQAIDDIGDKGTDGQHQHDGERASSSMNRAMMLRPAMRQIEGVGARAEKSTRPGRRCPPVRELRKNGISSAVPIDTVDSRHDRQERLAIDSAAQLPPC